MLLDNYNLDKKALNKGRTLHTFVNAIFMIKIIDINTNI